jgi:hypothetical protein
MYDHLREMSAQAEIPVCGFRLYAETENVVAQATYKDCGMNHCEYLMFEQLSS